MSITVKVLNPGDGNLSANEVIPIEDFLDQVKWVLAHGGQMPVAIYAEGFEKSYANPRGSSRSNAVR